MIRLKAFFPIVLALILGEIRVFSEKRVLEKSLVDQFVDHAMIRSFGAYTLFGIKPITEIDISYSPEVEDPKDCSPWGTATKNQWIAFKEKIDLYELRDHFFVESSSLNYESVFFVHQKSLVQILETYHHRFEKAAGGGFDSIEKVNELKNGGSEFWDAVFKEENHILMGLVFGFGKKNSECFDQEISGNEALKQMRINHTPLEELTNLFFAEISIEDLPLPRFFSYNEADEVVNAYRKFRREIIKNLKHKDLTEEVFRILRDGSSKLEYEKF